MTALGNILVLIRELADENADSGRISWPDSVDSDSSLGEVLNFIREVQADNA